MKKMFIAYLAFAVNIFSAAAYSATGEYWEITSKMEMPGMPFAMPATTSKVCLPPGGEKDPERTRDKKSNCEMTDVKTSGNKVSYKGKCVEKDGTMNMEGENTYDRDSYNGIVHMTGKSHGRDMDMKMTSSGKRVGGSCDIEELVKKAQAQAKEQEKVYGEHMAKACDTSGYSASAWVSQANLFIGRAGKEPTCPGKQEALCQAVRNDVSHDPQAYSVLVQQEQKLQKSGYSIAKTCNVDLESLKVSTCKANAKKAPLTFLDANCPAEAKAAREEARKQAIYDARWEDCNHGAAMSRGYTSEKSMEKCIAESTVMPEEGARSGPSGREMSLYGAMKRAEQHKSESSTNTPRDNKVDKDSTGDAPSKGEEDKSKSNNPAQSVIDSAKNLNTDSVIDGAKKLKGMFGF